MSDVASVPIWTTVTNVINADYDPTPVPYRRIMSVQIGPSEYASCPDIGQDPLTPELLRFPNPESAARFMRYFGSVIAKNDIRLKRFVQGRERPETDYNCHELYDAVLDDRAPDGQQAAYDRSQRLVRGSIPLRGLLALGERGGVLVEDDKGPKLAHTFIGQGEDTVECLNTWSIGGAIGITTYEDILKWCYEQRGGEYSVSLVRPGLGWRGLIPRQRRAGLTTSLVGQKQL